MHVTSPFRGNRPVTSVALALLLALMAGSCSRQNQNTVLVYCAVDEPYAANIFADFEKRTGILITPLYDIESSKSVGLSQKLEAEKDHPHADVWWGSEAFLSVRIAKEDVLAPYRPAHADDVLPAFRDAKDLWTGVGLRARVLAVSTQVPPPFAVAGIRDLADPRLKGKVAISVPTAGATGAHMAALYVNWGPDKAGAFFTALHDNDIRVLGGNAEVANAVGAGQFSLGLTDSDDVLNAQGEGGKLSLVIPDQNGEGTLAMPTTVALVNGAPHSAAAKQLIDYLTSPEVEKRLIDVKFARWSVRGASDQSIKAMPVDYSAAAAIYARAQQEGNALLRGEKR